MAIGHDSNSLSADNLPLFVKDNTNLKQWRDEEREKIGKLGNENNLDPSYHGARVMITSKKNKMTMDTGSGQLPVREES